MTKFSEPSPHPLPNANFSVWRPFPSSSSWPPVRCFVFIFVFGDGVAVIVLEGTEISLLAFCLGLSLVGRVQRVRVRLRRKVWGRAARGLLRVLELEGGARYSLNT